MENLPSVNEVTGYGVISNIKFQEMERSALNYFELRKHDNPSFGLYASMVYGFAKNLPYSIDVKQEEFVPASFFNVEPLDVDENPWFKYDDRRTLFNAMRSWGDTFRSSMLIQVCSMFQQMILGNIPSTLNFSENDYVRLGINKLIEDEEYNRMFFEALKTIPTYYAQISRTDDIDARRKVLEDFYNDVCIKIQARKGGFRYVDANGTVISETKPSIYLQPDKDVAMYACFQHYELYDVKSLNIVQEMKDIYLKKLPQQEETKRIRG